MKKQSITLLLSLAFFLPIMSGFCATNKQIDIFSEISIETTEGEIQHLVDLVYNYETKYGNLRQVIADSIINNYAQSGDEHSQQLINQYNSHSQSYANSLLGRLQTMSQQYAPECRPFFWQISESITLESTLKFMEEQQPEGMTSLGDSTKIRGFISQQIKQRITSCCR